MTLTRAPLGSMRRLSAPGSAAEVHLLLKPHDVAALVDLDREVGKDCCLTVNNRRQLRSAVNESATISSQSIRPDWNPDHVRQVAAGARRSGVRR